MTNKEIFKLSRQKTMENGIFAIIVFLFMALVISSLCFLNLLFDGLIIPVVLIFILPICFAFQLIIISMRKEGTLTFGMLMLSFTQYFSPRFRGNFGVLGTLWRVLIIYGATSITSLIVVNLVFYNMNILGFATILNDLLSKPITTEAVELAIENNANLFNVYRMCLVLPSLVTTTLGSLFFTSRNSVSFFLRVSELKEDGSYLSKLNDYTIRIHKGKFYKTFFMLNWPFFLLFIGGLALGGYVGSLYNFSSQSIYTFGIAFALLISFGLYGFRYFANKEALYLSMIEEYMDTNKKMRERRQKEIERLRQEQQNYNQLIARLTEEQLKEEEQEEENSKEDDDRQKYEP